jgi:hypothetical protein
MVRVKDFQGPVVGISEKTGWGPPIQTNMSKMRCPHMTTCPATETSMGSSRYTYIYMYIYIRIYIYDYEIFSICMYDSVWLSNISKLDRDWLPDFFLRPWPGWFFYHPFTDVLLGPWHFLDFFLFMCSLSTWLHQSAEMLSLSSNIKIQLIQKRFWCSKYLQSRWQMNLIMKIYEHVWKCKLSEVRRNCLLMQIKLETVASRLQ